MSSIGQQPSPPGSDGVTALLQRIHGAIIAGDPAKYVELLAPDADRDEAVLFASGNFMPGTTRAVVQERDRGPLKGVNPGEGYQVLAEVFVEGGNRARVATWRLDVRRTGAPGATNGQWSVIDQQVVSSIQGLYRLAIDTTRQFAARDLVVIGEDLQLSLGEGSVFVAEASGGATALILIGSGAMTYQPAPAAERDQVRIFSGSDTLTTPFDVALVRVNPYELDTILRGSIEPRAVDPRALQKADAFFKEQIGKSFSLDLSDLSPDLWSLLPNGSDILADVHTRRFGTLTYARSNSEPEDITLFDRQRRKNIALYSSREKLAARGRFYDEDDLADYDVIDYDLNVALGVDRQMVVGRALIRLVTREPATSSLTLRLAESLAVRSVVSSRYGRLLAVRVRNQNSVVVNFPEYVSKGTAMTLSVEYGGRLAPQPIDREIVEFGQDPLSQDPLLIPIEDSFLYSNRSYWYPQAPNGDYATATLRLTVPSYYSVVASGQLLSNSAAGDAPAAGDSRQPQGAPSKTYLFRAGMPVRYLSCVITRLSPSGGTDVAADAKPGVADPSRVGGFQNLTLRVEANPRQVGRGRDLVVRAAEILRFYSSLAGDFPYPTLTTALVERELPGGHSPAYMAVLNQPVAGTRLVWQNDPASFNDYPDFFLAHELAHQWWGQAVGWKNYHEQWLSEGLAQYFAALYAERTRGATTFEGILRQLRMWAMRESGKGAIYLGYRVGHIQSDGRLFRAVVYNKGAAVLHMLRRLIGDEAFFGGIRNFYRTWRFSKAGTEDLRAELEASSGVSLERFFERWVYNAPLPNVRFSWRSEGTGQDQRVVLRFEQQGDVFDFPVSVRLESAAGPAVTVLVKVTEKVVEQRVPFSGRLLRVVPNADGSTLADFRQ